MPCVATATQDSAAEGPFEWQKPEVKGRRPLPVPGVDPAGALVNVVNVVDFAVEVPGFLPTLGQRQLLPRHVGAVSMHPPAHRPRGQKRGEGPLLSAILSISSHSATKTREEERKIRRALRAGLGHNKKSTVIHKSGVETQGDALQRVRHAEAAGRSSTPAAVAGAAANPVDVFVLTFRAQVETLWRLGGKVWE